MDSISLTCILYFGQKNVDNFLKLMAMEGCEGNYLFSHFTHQSCFPEIVPVFHLKACLSLLKQRAII